VKVVLHDRTNGLGQELRETAERKLTRLARHFGKVADAEVDFSEERKRSGLTTTVVRINVHLDGRKTPVLSAHERGADPQSALDLALDKIDRQLVRHKEKIKHRKQPVSAVRVPVDEDTSGLERSDEPERIRLKLRPMTPADAVAELNADSQAFLVYLDEDSGAIHIAVKRADGSVAVIEPVVT
jgi:ribosome hibernation promoting factor